MESRLITIHHGYFTAYPDFILSCYLITEFYHSKIYKMQTQQNMKKNKRTQGTFFIDAGDTISELLLRVETKEEGNTELFDICDFSSDETGNVKANAEFICEAANNYDKLKEDNKALQKAMSTLTGMYSKLKEDNEILLGILKRVKDVLMLHTGDKNFSDEFEQEIKDVIKKTEIK